MLHGLEVSDLLFGIVLWIIVYLCDYYLTLWGNQLYIRYGKNHIQFGGSYELNPIFQKDVDGFKMVSRRFVIFLLVYTAWLMLMWLGARLFKLPQGFQVGVGYLILMEIPVLENHIQNINLFRHMKNTDVVDGQITYTRWVTMTFYVARFAYWAVIYAALFVITGSWFFVGGVLSSILISVRYRMRVNALRRQVQQIPKKPANDESSPTAPEIS